ncbi:unnamed protein product [Trichobilharzia regenti]|nr:unnamed protein product [Trichobilharzia regenti]
MLDTGVLVASPDNLTFLTLSVHVLKSLSVFVCYYSIIVFSFSIWNTMMGTSILVMPWAIQQVTVECPPTTPHSVRDSIPPQPIHSLLYLAKTVTRDCLCYRLEVEPWATSDMVGEYCTTEIPTRQYKYMYICILRRFIYFIYFKIILIQRMRTIAQFIFLEFV